MVGHLVSKYGFLIQHSVFNVVVCRPQCKNWSRCLGSISSHTELLYHEKAIKRSFQEASGLALAGLTAYGMVIDIAKLESGQTVFINGGSTSVGRYAIEIAKAVGCQVVASCSTSSMERVKGYGADEVCFVFL